MSGSNGVLMVECLCGSRALHLVLWIISLSFLRHYDSHSKAGYPGMHVLNLLYINQGSEYILLVNYSTVSGREKGGD